MMEGLLTLVRPASAGTLARDLLDVAIVAYAIYRLMLLLRGTRAVQVSFGLGLVVVVYLLAHRTGLTTTYTLLDRLLGSFFLVVVVLFQGDLRRAFMRVGTRPWFVRFRKREEASALEEVVEACTRLAQKRIGALIVFERDASLDDFVQQGTQLDAEVTSELLYTVFVPGYENPLHDGAVLIRNARLYKAGAFLPLTANPGLDRTLGTRHRAAIGISEETDAVVVIVSEERGQISLCFNGNLVRGLDAQSLRHALYGLFYPKPLASRLLARRAGGRREEEASRISLTPAPHNPRVETRQDVERGAQPGGDASVPAAEQE
jgi:diadenylate cyclase